MITLRQQRLATQFFADIAAAFMPANRVPSIVVTHLLGERALFLDGVHRVAPVGGVIPKPRSANPNVRSWLQHRYSFLDLSRGHFERQPEQVLRDLLRVVADQPCVLLDVGGYFAPLVALPSLAGRVIGIIEDTENGVQKYEAARRKATFSCPVISVARSPLKDPEDYLVGQSVVFSTEAVMRERGEIIHGRTACVVGYGKLGRSIASMLHARQLRVTVFDTDSLKRVEALAHGFAAAESLREALAGREFVFCATGNRSLKAGDFALLKDGACVSTVTSPDDELDLTGLRERYRAIHDSEFVTRYRAPGHEFYLLNRGQAVNFLHGAVVGPFIFLVQAEIVASVSQLTIPGLGPGLHENPTCLRRKVAEIWCRCYGKS
jgi:adenosylhomocysteinase